MNYLSHYINISIYIMHLEFIVKKYMNKNFYNKKRQKKIVINIYFLCI